MCSALTCIRASSEKHLYVNSELESNLLIYDTSTLALISKTDLTTPDLPTSIRELLLTAELYSHPIHTETLYVSLRGTQRMDEMGIPRGYPDLPSPPSEDIQNTLNKHKGDSIAVVLLSDQASSSHVEEVIHVQTGLDWIRGMRVSDDGKYMAAAGEFGAGGLEIYEISGQRGEMFKLVVRDDSVKDVNCVLWL